MSDYPRDDLIRMVSLTSSSIEVRSEGDGNELIGYGAVFNEDTVINGWEGHFVERIAPGAFRKTLEERGDRVKIQFDHGMDTRFGGAPIAVPVELKEDDRGLYVRARFVDTEAGRDAKELIRSGAVDGMSFRFSVVREDVDNTPDLPVRTVREVRLYEVGPVTWPAYEATTVGVRSAEAMRLLRAAQISSTPDAAPDQGTSDVAPDTPPLAPVGAHIRRGEQALRRLNRNVLKETR